MYARKLARVCVLFGILSLLITQSITVNGPAAANTLAESLSYLPVVTRYLGYRESTGVFDPSFDGDGIVLTSLTGHGVVQALAVQPDGKIIAAGWSGTQNNIFLALVRYHPDGNLDTSFGSDGKVLSYWTGYTPAFAVALQPDGKIIAAGQASSDGGHFNFALVRYNPDGSPDSDFGSDGLIITDFNGSNDGASAIALQPDGKILVGGNSYNGDPYTGTDYDFALARYNPDGTLDASFGSDGKVTTDFYHQDDYGKAMALQPDGKILLAGSANDCPYACFALARYNPDGNLDASFGNNGWVTADMEQSHDSAQAMLLQPDGKMLISGFSWSEAYYPHFAAVRYHADGVLDLGLGVDGKLITDWGYWAEVWALALQPDGKILMGGYASPESGQGFALARYTPEGSLDESFGEGGRVITEMNGRAYAMAVQADGRIILAGEADTGNGTVFALVRYK